MRSRAIGCISKTSCGTTGPSINGRRDELAARLQERYGFARSEAEREIGAWIRCQRHAAA